MRKKGTWWRWVIGLVLAGVLCGGAALGVLCYAETHPVARAENSQAIIVLGAQVYADGRLSLQLTKRMETALDEYRRNPRLIVVCGGQGKDEPLPEGEAMRQWLVDQGVSAEDILVDAESVNTRGNLQNAKAMLPEEVTQVTIVTSDYHLPRALQLARDFGLSADGIGSPCMPEYWVKNHSRELLAWGKYILEKITK